MSGDRSVKLLPFLLSRIEKIGIPTGFRRSDFELLNAGERRRLLPDAIK